MDNRNIQQKIENLDKRVAVLEAVMISVKTSKPTADVDGGKSQKSEYSGPKGGVLLLISERFLNNKKTVDDVWLSLEKKGYIYKKDVIRTALNRLSRPNGPLVKIEEKGKKVYVERK